MFQTASNAFPLLANIKGREDGNLTRPAFGSEIILSAVAKMPKHWATCSQFFFKSCSKYENAAAQRAIVCVRRADIKNFV